MLTTIAPPVADSAPLPPPRRVIPPLDTRRMVWALAKKELRELAPWIIVACLMEFYFWNAAIGVWVPFTKRSPTMIPFVRDMLAGMMLVVGGLFGIVIGFWQTSWESSRGTFQFLLHRPLTRDAVFAIKLGVGAVTMLLISGATLLSYGVWASLPGTLDRPFFWSMTIWAWGVWSALPVVYGGAFLSGLRPARWYGSQLLPLAAALLWAAFVSAVSWGFGTWAGLSVSVTGSALYLFVILYVARTRDFS